MKYKIGDRVRVKKGLEYGKIFVEGMDVDSIEIEDVTNGFYRTHLSNGKEYAYTDEMLDGLVDEPEGEPEKPTDAELIQAAKLLKANCKNQKDCHKCIFFQKSTVNLSIKHRKNGNFCTARHAKKFC